MSRDELNNLKDLFLELMFSEKIIPNQMIDKIGNIFSDPQFSDDIKTAWIKKNGDRTKKLDLNSPLFISRGSVPENESGKLLPEEKLVSCKEIFRNKIDAVDFGNINVFHEKKIIDELKSECSDVSMPEIILYYNLYKIDAILKNKKPETAAGRNGRNDFPAMLLKSLEENFFLTFDNMFRMNGNSTVHKDIIVRILEEKKASGKINHEILLFLFDERNRRLTEKMKSFLENIAESNGDDPVEIFNYLAFYIIINGADSGLIRYLQLSDNLGDFSNGKPGGIKPLYHQAIIFIFSYIIEIAGFVYKISNKYKISGGEQKSKLVKLIDGARMRLFIDSVRDLSVRKLASFHTDVRELLPYIKKFIRMNRNMVTSDDLFH